MITFELFLRRLYQTPLGTAYTIWTGIGAVGAFGVGVFVLGEPVSALRIFAAGLIISGVALLKLATPA